MPRRILVIEDEQDIRELIAINLSDVGHDIDTADTGRAGLTAASGPLRPELILLDLNLPDVDGIDVCRQLRSDGCVTPILMLTARDAETDRVLGLEMGADDYLTKPFSIRELQARVKAILRRAELNSQAAAETITTGDLHINLAGRSVLVKGTPVDLTSRESDLIAHLAKHPGRVFSRTQLLDQVWGYQHAGYEQHRQLTHQSPAHQGRAGCAQSRVSPDGLGHRVQIPRLKSHSP